ncbi:MAG: hypothetical protein KBD01_18255 [Acidobacteria bacterium]|nr:hypothetical protein [Acidobacteriota bacterium]
MPMRLDADGNLTCERCGMHLGYWLAKSGMAFVFSREAVKRMTRKRKAGGDGLAAHRR